MGIQVIACFFRSLLRRILLYPEYLHLKFAGRGMYPFRGEGRILDVGCGSGEMWSTCANMDGKSMVWF